MKALHLALLIPLALSAGLAAAETITGSGHAATQEREARGFSGIGLSLSARVEVVQGAVEGVRITADDNVLPEIESVVEAGVLKLRLREGTRIRTKVPIRVVVNAKTMESIAISGSGQVHAPELAAQRLAVKVSGSGDAHVGGRAEAFEVRISGSGDVKAHKLDARQASISIAGSGDAVVWARSALKVRVAGSGDVRYYGDPSVEKTIAGSGSVRRLGAAPS